MKNLLDAFDGFTLRASLLEADDSDQKSALKNDYESMKKGAVNVGQVIEKLNTIRSGKSFKDDAIKASLEEYFNALKKPEQVALLAFLKGIAQIVTGEVVGDKAVEPEDPAPAISMKKTEYKRVVKPVIIKKSKSTKGAEDTTPPTPAPIKPKA